MTMLLLIVTNRPSTARLALIGEESALECALASFVPVVSEHVAGILNIVADQLSRLSQPHKSPAYSCNLGRHNLW